MKLKYFLTAVLTLIFLRRAAQVKDHMISDYEFHFPVLESKTIGEMLTDSEVQCDERTCPDAVGQIVAREQTSFAVYEGTCTGFLVAPDIVATNSHCIPQSVKRKSVHLVRRPLGIRISRGTWVW